MIYCMLYGLGQSAPWPAHLAAWHVPQMTLAKERARITGLTLSIVKLGPINFPQEIIKAIREERLVVFAGAGVSKGEPANLPNLRDLADDIAKQAGESSLKETEPEDRFLGQLHKKQVEVHRLAANILNRGSFTPLHQNLLRLFRNPAKTRVVTTNFDTLFEAAANKVLNKSVEVYNAPALPLGHDFTGIVHIHGCLDKPDTMLLTDADFGRAYLTEGWARRFLLGLFREYPVLFVGYSHDDVVMHYLSRALLPEDTERKFALVGDDTGTSKWKSLEIQPVIFHRTEEDRYAELDEGVSALAEYVSQGTWDWKTRITAIASGVPPADEENIDRILDALRDESTTRFFVKMSQKPDWIEWLDERELLAPLFEEGELKRTDQLLAEWLTDKFALQHPEKLILLVSRHGGKNINPYLWYLLGEKFSESKADEIGQPELAKWVSLLLNTKPDVYDGHVLLWLTKRCAKQGDINTSLLIFGSMLSHRLEVKREFAWPNGEEEGIERTGFDVSLPSPVYGWVLHNAYKEHIKPSLNTISAPLLSVAINELEKRHSALIVWNADNRNRDRDSVYRFSIGPHEEDRAHAPLNVLVDVARDSLVSLGETNNSLSDCWLDILSKSDAPLVRRIFIHGLDERTDKSADEKLDFFLSGHDGLYQEYACHEVHRLIFNLYPGLSRPKRSELIRLILEYEYPDADREKSAKRAAQKHLDWLRRLLKADSSCRLAEQAEQEIINRYPDFQHQPAAASTYPGSIQSVEQLLEKPVPECIDALSTSVVDEWELQRAVMEKARGKVAWGLDMANELAEKSQWETALWKGLLHAWEEWSPEEKYCKKILKWLDTRKLWEHHLGHITNTLQALMRRGGHLHASELLGQSNKTATALWGKVKKEIDFPDSNDAPLQFAINSPPGILAGYWLGSIQLWKTTQTPSPVRLPDSYRKALSQIIRPESEASGISLTILASRVAFLLSTDYDWTKENLLDWFDIEKDSRRFQQAWGGLLFGGELTWQVAEELGPRFQKASAHLEQELKSYKDRFINYFATSVFFFVSNPQTKWLPIFLKEAEPDAKRELAEHIGSFLRDMDVDQQKRIWGKWLKEYWQKRVKGLPLLLDPLECAAMVEWAPLLDEALFREATELATKMPPARFENRHPVTCYLSESDMVTRHPEETVKLLIYILGSEFPDGLIYYYIQEIVRKLDRENVQQDLLTQLDSLLAKHGVPRDK